ncbi:MAG TPA: response regulator [Candidatus Lokiarchaeia archaeon]|nr:response regulator [Candidatus Lokiarchaeia archaeon]
MNTSARVLLVDDDAGIRETMKDILAFSNVQLVTACNGHDAIELASNNEFDIALIDLRMSGIDGIETFKRIRKIKPTFKAFLVTAYADETQAKEAIKEGFSGIYYKPVDIPRIITMLTKYENER